MTRVFVELESLEAAEAQFRKELAAYERVLAELDRRLRGGLAEWTGEARHAYERAHERWMADARRMAEAIAEFHKAIRHAHANFTISVDANQRMWRWK